MASFAGSHGTSRGFCVEDLIEEAKYQTKTPIQSNAIHLFRSGLPMAPSARLFSDSLGNRKLSKSSTTISNTRRYIQQSQRKFHSKEHVAESVAKQSVSEQSLLIFVYCESFQSESFASESRLCFSAQESSCSDFRESVEIFGKGATDAAFEEDDYCGQRAAKFKDWAEREIGL